MQDFFFSQLANSSQIDADVEKKIGIGKSNTLSNTIQTYIKYTQDKFHIQSYND